MSIPPPPSVRSPASTPSVCGGSGTLPIPDSTVRVSSPLNPHLSPKPHPHPSSSLPHTSLPHTQHAHAAHTPLPPSSDPASASVSFVFPRSRRTSGASVSASSHLGGSPLVQSERRSPLIHSPRSSPGTSVGEIPSLVGVELGMRQRTVSGPGPGPGSGAVAGRQRTASSHSTSHSNSNSNSNSNDSGLSSPVEARQRTDSFPRSPLHAHSSLLDAQGQLPRVQSVHAHGHSRSYPSPGVAFPSPGMGSGQGQGQGHGVPFSSSSHGVPFPSSSPLSSSPLAGEAQFPDRSGENSPGSLRAVRWISFCPFSLTV